MATDTQTSNARPRLNPFAFPSDTDFRFVMLIVAVIGSSILIYAFLYNVFPANAKVRVTIYVSCLRALLAAPHGISIASQYAVSNNLEQCIISSNQTVAEWVGLGIALLLSVAAAIYWILPILKIWRGGFKPLHTYNAPAGMTAYLVDLCHQSELARSPIFLLNPYSSASSGVAFGRLGRYYIVLHKGLVMLFQTDLPAFRCIVLHELGHIRNTDINKTYFTIAIVWSFGLTSLLPWIVSLFLSSWTFDDIVNVGWRLLALTVLIYLIRNAILRTREVYADARASIWDGSSGALGRFLKALPTRKSRGWRRFLSTHPNPEERNQVLENTSSLFHQSFWDAFVTGLIVTIVISSASIFNLLLSSSSEFIGTIIAGIISALLIVGIVGLGMWRTISAQQAGDKTRLSIIIVTLGLTLGLLLGQPLSFATYYSGTSFFTNPWGVGQSNSSSGQAALSSLFNQAGLTIVVSILLLLILFFFLHWIRSGAAVWLKVAAWHSSPQRTYLAGLVIASCALGIVLELFSQSVQNYQGSFAIPGTLQEFQIELGLPAQTPLIYTILLLVYGNLIYSPFLTIAFISLWAYPLATWFWRKRTTEITQASWAFLDVTPQVQQIRPPYETQFRLRLALTLGLICGLAYYALLYLFDSGLKLNISIQDDIVLALLLQGGIAAIVASTVQRMAVLHGLFSAFVAGCMMIIGLLGISLPSGGVTYSAIIELINAGAALALIVGLIVSGLAVLARRFQRNLYKHAI